MMKIRLLVIAFALSATAAAAQSVEVASGDWSNIPMVAKAKPIRMADRTMARIDDILEAKKCTRFGTGKRVRIDVPFLVQFSGDTAQRLVVRKIDCPELESLIGGTLVSHLREGLIKPTGENQTGWYQSNFNYYRD
jgi:hypothetical protein